jgi:hypothetical protein
MNLKHSADLLYFNASHVCQLISDNNKPTDKKRFYSWGNFNSFLLPWSIGRIYEKGAIEYNNFQQWKI